MKLCFGVLANIAVALAFGISLTHSLSDSPAAEMMRTNVPQLAPEAVVPSPRTSAAVESSPQDIFALQQQVREQRRAGPRMARGREERPGHDSRPDPDDRADV